MHKDTHQMLRYGSPRFADAHGMPQRNREDCTIVVTFDEVTTMATLIHPSAGAMAVGIARRHPKDKRNPALGASIAMARLGMSMAEKYGRQIDRYATPEPEPDAELVAALRRANRSIRAQAKNEKRRAARDRWYANQDQDQSADDWRGRTFGDWGHA